MVLAYLPLLKVNYYVLFADSDIMKSYIMGEGSKETNGKKLFLQNEGGYRDGLKNQKGERQGVVIRPE